MEARRYKLTIAYDGTRYAGYQLQANGLAVQQVLEETLSYLDRAPVRVFGCSRTDAGVHARGFVAHCDLVQPIPPQRLVRAANARMPQDVRLLRAALARPDFDARTSAVGKEYRYSIFNAQILPPQMAPYWEWTPHALDIGAMREAAARFVGRRDFAPFAANPHRDVGSTVRSVFFCGVRKSGPRLVVTVCGDGFLYKQVRSMVGFLMRVGKGDEPPEAVTEILEKRSPRTARVPTAPGKGLCLWRVFYGQGELRRRLEREGV